MLGTQNSILISALFLELICENGLQGEREKERKKATFFIIFFKIATLESLCYNESRQIFIVSFSFSFNTFLSLVYFIF